MEMEVEELKSVKDFEEFAVSKMMDKEAKLYFSAGALSCTTPRDNEKAFEKYRIRPRMLRDVSDVTLQTTLLNCELSCPIGVSPTGFHFLIHPGAEIATARGCARENSVFILSTISTCAIDDISKRVNEIPEAKPTLWMQVYILRDRSVTLQTLKTAENAGFSAIVVTVDSPVSGLWRIRADEDFKAKIKDRCVNIPGPTPDYLDPTLTFKDLKWLVENTKLPVVAKGIMTGEDAKEAVQCGVSAILVSNHGGRQIHRVISTIDVLEEVVEAVQNSGVEVYIDSGIRTGSDIFVALALGAKAAFIGRPAIWGLSVQGEEGVQKVLQILKAEFLKTMQLAGVSRIQDIRRSMVQKVL